ncbi:MAG: RhuM family protein [Bacteroidales bacterium]
MRMADYIRELNNILSSIGRKVIDSAGTISHKQAHDKAVQEYKKYKAKTFWLG